VWWEFSLATRDSSDFLAGVLTDDTHRIGGQNSTDGAPLRMSSGQSWRSV
jgi:hypothetical protein